MSSCILYLHWHPSISRDNGTAPCVTPVFCTASAVNKKSDFYVAVSVADGTCVDSLM